MAAQLAHAVKHPILVKCKSISSHYAATQACHSPNARETIDLLLLCILLSIFAGDAAQHDAGRSDWVNICNLGLARPLRVARGTPMYTCQIGIFTPRRVVLCS